MSPGNEVAPVNLRQRLPHHLPLARRRERIFGGNGLGQFLPLQQFRISYNTLRRRIGDSSVDRHQPRTFSLPVVGCQIDQHLTGGGSGAPYLRAHNRCTAAAKCSHVEWREVRVTHNHADSVRWYAQFFRHSLGERRSRVLSHLYLARVDGYHAVLPDVQPGGDFLRQRFAEAAATGLLPRPGVFQNARDSNPPADQLEELAPAGLEAVRRRGGELVAFWFGLEEN